MNKENEEDLDFIEWEQCDICGLTDDHSLDCPKSNSPFSLLIREGYD